MPTQGNRPDLAERQLMLALRAQGLSCAQIGRRLGVTRQTVFTLLKKHGAGQVLSFPVACAHCGTPVTARRGPGRHPRGVTCLACLSRSPQPSFAQRLKACRLRAGLTRQALGRKIGLSGEGIANYERGSCRPSPAVRQRLTQILGPELRLGGSPTQDTGRD